MVTLRALPLLLGTLLAPAPLAGQVVRADSLPRGSVAGTVLDAVTGDPLAGAVVTLEPAPGGAVSPASGGGAFWSRGRSAMTDLSGVYRFTDVPSGAYRLLVRRLGYRPTMLELSLRSAAALRVSVGLAVQPVLLEPERAEAPAVPFVGAAVGDPADDGRLDLELHRQRTYAGTDVRMLTRAEVVEAVTLGETDLFRAFHRLPGVTTRDDFTAALWTRGAPWSHTRVYFDGLPLFNPVHTVGVFSGLNPDGVGAVVFHPGVRSAALGEGAAAALEVKSRRPPQEFRGGAELSVVSMRTTVGAGGAGGGVTVAARRSYVDLATDLLADSADAVPYAFYDLTGRADLRLGPATVLEVSGLWERDEVRGTVRDLLRDTEGHWGNAAGRLALTAPLGPLFTRHSVGLSRFSGRLRQDAVVETELGLAPAHQPTDNALTYVTVGSSVEPASGRWAAGWELVHQRQAYAGAPPRPYPQAVISDSLVLEERLAIPVLWGEVRAESGPVRVVAGLRAEFLAGVRNASRAVAPRLAVRWTPDARTAVSAGYGRSWQYSQALAPAGPGVGPELHLTDVWLMAGDTIPAIRSDIVSAGVERWIGDAWLGAVNVYGRRATGIAEPWPVPGTVAGRRPLFAAATNRAAGIELSARRLAGRWTGSVAYTLGVSRMAAVDITYPAATDRRHVLDATAMVRLGPSVRVGGAFTAAAGSPYTRFTVDPILCDSVFAGGCGDVAQGDTVALATQAIELAGAQRTRPYVSLNLLAEWTRDFGGWRLGAWVQVRNALNARNAVTYLGTFDHCVDPGPDDVVVGARCDRFDRGLPLLPLAGVSVAF